MTKVIAKHKTISSQGGRLPYILVVLQALFFACPDRAMPRSNKKIYPKYSQFKEELYRLIVNAKQELWVASEQLSDHDFASILYIAKFRGLKINLLTTATAANSSTIYLLKDYGFSIKRAKKSFFKSAKTMILVDQSLYLSNHKLTKEHRLNKTLLYQTKRHSITAFKAHFASPGQQDPLVALSYRSSRKSLKMAKPTQKVKPFFYKSNDRIRPKHIRGTLPKITKWQRAKK